MKSLKLSAAALLLACSFGAPSIAAACPGKKGAHQAEKDKKKDAPARVASASFHVTGMSCDGCGEKVRTALAQTAGIVKQSLVVNLPGKPASIRVCLDAVFPAVPYCIELAGGPYLEGNPAVVQVFRPRAK
jgi:copper chaperone CopZ